MTESGTNFHADKTYDMYDRARCVYKMTSTKYFELLLKLTP